MKKCCKCGVQGDDLRDAKFYSAIYIGEEIVVNSPKYFCRSCGQEFRRWGKGESRRQSSFEYLNMSEAKYGFAQAYPAYY